MFLWTLYDKIWRIIGRINNLYEVPKSIFIGLKLSIIYSGIWEPFKLQNTFPRTFWGFSYYNTFKNRFNSLRNTSAHFSNNL